MSGGADAVMGRLRSESHQACSPARPLHSDQTPDSFLTPGFEVRAGGVLAIFAIGGRPGSAPATSAR